MSGYHDPLDTFQPKEETSQSSAHWYRRDLEIEDWDQKKRRYTEEELAQHRAEWLAIKKANDEKNAKEQASFPQPDNPSAHTKEHLQMNDYKKLALQIVIIVCATWIICTMMNSCANRYYAIAPNQQILDKHSGEIFHPGVYPSKQAFGEKLERISE